MALIKSGNDKIPLFFICFFLLLYAGAQIDVKTGALMTTIPEGEDLDIGAYPEGVYHRYDYAFRYRNLQQNVGDRINAYLQKT